MKRKSERRMRWPVSDPNAVARVCLECSGPCLTRMRWPVSVPNAVARVWPLIGGRLAVARGGVSRQPWQGGARLR